MQRSSLIATVIAAGGILIAGSVASVAVINAASSSQADSETIQLVAAGSTDTASPEATETATAEATTAAAPQSSAAAALPSVVASALPALPEVSDAPAPQATTPTKPAKNTATPTKSAANTPAPARQEASTVSADAARAIVLKQGDGVSVVSTSKGTHQGYSTWAVRITRSNGEVLTGYVDRSSGVVVDWTIDQKAPAPTPSSSASEDDDDDSHESDDNSGSGSDDSGKDESGDDDHDSDDD